jgi:sigma-B regulation protein RsbU (phosphoserine phosphatase)
LSDSLVASRPALQATPVAAPRATVLVVDDQDMQRLIVRRTLGKMGYQVVEAASAEEALAFMAERPVDIVLSDWVMDGMDGTQLCQALRAQADRPYVYFILMSSRDSREDLLAGLSAGADDFLRKPLDVDELSVRLRAGERVLDLQARLRARQRELEVASQRIQEDVDAAAGFQRGLLPAHKHGQQEGAVQWLFMPSNAVSGDALNYFQVDDQHLVFYLMDVSGHGVAAAMVAMNVAQYLNPEVEGCVFKQTQGRREVLDAASAVAELNRRICAQETADKYLTCVYGVLELQTGRLQVVRAGHPVPMVVHADGTCDVIAEEGDVPVALFADAQYTNHELQLRPGSRLVVFSDGITECDDPVGEAYGEERLKRYFTSRADQPLQQVTAEFGLEIQAWRGFPTQTFQDDISLMVVEFGPRPERADNPLEERNPRCQF